MALRRIGLGVVAVVLVAIAVRVFVLGNEQVEHFFRSESPAYRPPDGEWIRSVPGAHAELWAVGDSAGGDGRDVAALIERSGPDRVLYLGDVYPSGTATDFRELDRDWGRLVPVMAPTPGNHDWPEANDGYDPYWQDATGRLPPTHYAFRAGSWQVLSLNSEHEEQAAQIEWLRRRTGAGGSCRVAFWHRPRFSAGPHGDSPAVDGLWRAARGRVAMVLSGHEHSMQRLRPDGGTVQFISGAGGFSHTEPARDDPRLAFGDHVHDGALRLRLRRGRADWAFVATDGQVLDSGALRCRP